MEKGIDMNKIIKPRYDNDTVLDILRRDKTFITADCGGNGRCGKCRVKFFDPEDTPSPSDADLELLKEQEIKDGFRLACTSVINDQVEIMIPDDSVVGEQDIKLYGHPYPSASEIIAVDYGTTVISGALVDLNEGITGEASVINRQKAYGADVVSRIEASSKGLSEELRHISLDDLALLAAKLDRDPGKVRYIISGNTVMQHIISGYSLRGMEAAPYEAVDVSMRRDGNITMLPGVSAFVGADIISGITASSLDTAKEPWLYVDIGTNGEMALGTGDRIYVASAPAGPAFEGGVLKYGRPFGPGVIDKVQIAGRRAVVHSEGDLEPFGICGAGAIDAVAGMVKNGIVDESGRMNEDYFDDGFPLTGDVYMTRSDVREVQKAKAAIRAGMEILIKESGVDRKDIDKFVISGTFGSGMDMENAEKIGLIPEDLAGIASTSGNASLTGATLYALDTGFGERLKRAAASCSEIVLADNLKFDAEYIRQLDF